MVLEETELVFLYLADAFTPTYGAFKLYFISCPRIHNFHKLAFKKLANCHEQREKNTRENCGEACANTSTDATQHRDSAMRAEEFPCILSRGSEDDRGVGGWEDVA